MPPHFDRVLGRWMGGFKQKRTTRSVLLRVVCGGDEGDRTPYLLNAIHSIPGYGGKRWKNMAIYRCYLDSRVLCIRYDLRFFNMHSMRRNMEHLCFYAKVVPQKTQTVYFAILMVFIGVCWYKMRVLLWYVWYRFMVRLWASGGIWSVCFHEFKYIKIRVCLCGRECGEDRPVSRHTISGAILMLHSIIGVHLWCFCAHWFIPGFSHIYLFAHTDFMLTL